jgi:aromatic ring-opening dioxygenase catalytic subunit (LigB family)
MIRHFREEVPSKLKLGSAAAPKAILLLTAHWQTDVPILSRGKSPYLYYDYSGFPNEGYNITYKADGSPEVARQAAELLEKGGFEARLDAERGW